MTKLTIESEEEPKIRFWLSQMSDGSICLEARHSEDQHDQTLLEIGYDDSGKLELRTRDIHTDNMLHELGIQCGNGIKSIFVNKSKVCPRDTQ